MNGMALCAGVGGLELGLRLALGRAYQTVCYCEREAFAASRLVARMESAHLDRAPVWDDLKTFDGTAWRGCVDLVSAGYPCQPWSVAGKRLGKRDPRHLWPEVRRIVEEVQPYACFFENVPGHLRLGFPDVRRDLQELGYRVEAGLWSSRGVGAPHFRRRLFILAVADATEPRRKEPVGPGECAGTTEGRAGMEHGPERLCCNMADTEGGGQRELRESSGRDGQPDGGGILVPGYRPPGPGDADAWADVLAVRQDLAPALKSCVCGVAHGLADRADRLRAVGNGVDPVVAATAFVGMAARLGLGRGDAARGEEEE